MKIKSILTTMGVFAVGHSVVTAAVVTWDPVIVNTTAPDIMTNGASHIAVNAGTAATSSIINGINFVAGEPLGDNTGDGTFWTTGDGVHTTGDAGLDQLLDSHSYAAGTPSSGSFDIVGLMVGQVYAVQLIAVGDTRTCCNTRTQSFGGGGSFSADLVREDPSSVIGYFTADAVTQTIDVNGSKDGGISGYQVRAVPEPGSVALLLGIFGVALRRRR